MKRKIIFRADAGKNIGFGHFIRSLALASYLMDDFDCVFTTFNPHSKTPSPYQLQEIARVCNHWPIDAEDIEEFNHKFLKGLTGGDIVVLDNYYFDTEFQKKIKEKGCKLVCVDDLHDREMVCDLLLTGMPLKREDFRLGPRAAFLGGLEHSFLREPFLMFKDKISVFPIRKIVIAIGGADPFELTNKIISIILKIDASLNIEVVAGDTVRINPEFKDKVNLHGKLTAEEIVDLFSSCDLGIFPASTVSIEALACNLRVAAGWYVDNQKELYEYGVGSGLFYPLGNLMDQADDIEKRIREAMEIEITCFDRATIDFQKGKEDIIREFKKL